MTEGWEDKLSLINLFFQVTSSYSTKAIESRLAAIGPSSNCFFQLSKAASKLSRLHNKGETIFYQKQRTWRWCDLL